jgi:hypothetical protein
MEQNVEKKKYEAKSQQVSREKHFSYEENS